MPGFTVPVTEVPKLEGWMSFEEVATLLGITKQSVHRMAWLFGEFDIDADVRAVGGRPLFIIRESAVHAKRLERDAKVAHLRRRV